MATSMFEATLKAAGIVQPRSLHQRLIVVESNGAMKETLHTLFTSEGYDVEFLPDRGGHRQG